MPQGKHRDQMAAETPARLAFDDCGQEDPAIRQSEFVGAASCAQVQEGKAGNRPTVKLSSVLGSTGPLDPFEARDYMRNVAVSATLNPPIFTGGLIGFQVRQAEAEAASVRVQLEVARRGAIQAVSQARAQRRAVQANTVSETAALHTAQVTFDGMRGKYRAWRGWAAIMSVVACFLCSSVASAAEDLPLDAQPPPQFAENIWKSVVFLLGSSSGEVDLQRLQSTLHGEVTFNKDNGGKREVYRGVVGSSRKLGFLFLPTQVAPANDWSISFFWLDKPQDLISFKLGEPPSDMCVHRKEIENDFAATGWTELFGFSRFNFPTNSDLPAFAVFKKKKVEMTVSVTRDGNCFYYLRAAAVPISKVDTETVK